MATLLHQPWIRRRLERHFFCAAPDKPECLALSFDDGPSPRNTERLLDLLKSKSISATFFVVGKRLQEFEDIARRAHAEGHLLANHSRSHWPLSLLPRAVVRRELTDTTEALLELTGEHPRYFRPPMGWFGPRLLRLLDELQLVPVLGACHPEDSKRPSVEQLMERMRPRLEPGGIVILHDGGWRRGVDRTPTIEAVDRLTDECLAQGRRFVTVDELAQGTRFQPDPLPPELSGT